jgi:hypothetical protein
LDEYQSLRVVPTNHHGRSRSLKIAEFYDASLEEALTFVAMPTSNRQLEARRLMDAKFPFDLKRFL